MAKRIECESVPEPVACGERDLVEFPLLLTNWQADALSRVAAPHGLSAGQLIRRAIGEFLGRPAPLPGPPGRDGQLPGSGPGDRR